MLDEGPENPVKRLIRDQFARSLLSVATCLPILARADVAVLSPNSRRESTRTSATQLHRRWLVGRHHIEHFRDMPYLGISSATGFCNHERYKVKSDFRTNRVVKKSLRSQKYVTICSILVHACTQTFA